MHDNPAVLTLKENVKKIRLKRKLEYDKRDVLDYFAFVKRKMKLNQIKENNQIRKMRIS